MAMLIAEPPSPTPAGEATWANPHRICASQEGHIRIDMEHFISFQATVGLLSRSDVLSLDQAAFQVHLPYDLPG